MPVFDITDNFIAGRNLRSELVHWLDQNVGEYHGRGEGSTVAIGHGWEMFVMRDHSREQAPMNVDYVVTWHVDITDPSLAAMFALRWT